MKKAIDWFALLVGVALALFGARWMWTGWDIVQAERGWTAVIAGSVMLSGGLIVAALAWAIMRLANAPATLGRAAVEEEPARPSGRPAIAMPATVAVGAAAGAAAGMSILRKKPETEPLASESPQHEALLQDTLPQDPLLQDTLLHEPSLDDAPSIAPPAPPTVGELLRMSEERVARESHEKIFEEPELAPAPPAEPDVRDSAWIEEPPPPAPVEIAEPEPAPAPMEIVEPPPLPPVALEPEPPAPEPEPPAPEPEPAPLRLPEAPPPVAPAAHSEEPVFDDWLERTAREFDRELGRDTVRDILPKEEPAPEPPPPPKPEPAVVGRYSSGDTNYLMFADGSIEAQTPEGVMRFASLTELKRFVEKRN